MSAMDTSDPPDRADEVRPALASSATPPPITNDKSANMLEDRIVHPAKRMWNTDVDEAVETSKRARLSESLENRLHDNSANEKLPHVNALSPVHNQDKDTNGDGSGDHLPQDTSNGELENSSPVVNNTKDSSLQEMVDESEKETSASPAETSASPAETTATETTSATETSAATKEASSLNSHNEDESMDVDSNSAASSAPVSPTLSGLETKRTEITENSKNNSEDSDKNVPSDTPSGLGSKELTKEGVDPENNCLAGVRNELDGRSPDSEKDTAAVSEETTETNQCGGTPSRTDEESSVGKTTTSGLENGDDKPLTSPTGTVANLKDMIKERFRDQVEKSGMDCEATSGKKEHTGSAKEDSTSKLNKEPSSSSLEDDVIVLSDDEMDEAADGDDASSIDTGPFSPLPDDNPLSKLTDDELDQRDKVIHGLQEELRTEEGKLLLLKKLRQSQMQPVQVVPKEGAATATSIASGTAPVLHKVSLTPTVSTSLPQLLRTSQGTKIQLSAHQQQQHLQQLKQLQQLQQQQKAGGRIIQMPQLVRGSQIQTVGRSVLTTQSGPPPLVMVSRSGTQGQQLHNARHIIRVSGTGTVSTTSLQNAGTHVVNQLSRTSTSMANDSQSAASRQAAAKLALRKQLEKTLLQIPPPKPPPPELHFLPSAANNEFIILVGLEEVVNTILEVEKDSKKKTPQRFTDPFRCAQCKTDFTTIWKQDAKQGIMCETCIVSNQKKSLKAEHTNRLKTAFVKALQQEQEIEQRMQQGQNPIIHSTQQTARQLHQISQIQSSQQTRHRVMNPVPHQQRTVLNPAPTTQRVMQPVTYTYIPHMGSVKNSNQSFTYRVPSTQIQMVTKNQISTSHHSAAARQREYLLDMIPSKVLSQNTTVPWKR